MSADSSSHAASDALRAAVASCSSAAAVWLWDTAPKDDCSEGGRAINPEILRYITANRDTYTREVITRRLIEAGHDPAEIELVWESIEPRSEGRLPRDRTFWRYFTVYVVALYGLTFLVYALGLGMDIAMFLGLSLVVGAWVSIRTVRTSPAVVTGAASGLLIAALVPFVLLVIIAGLCTAMVGFPVG